LRKAFIVVMTAVASLTFGWKPAAAQTDSCAVKLKNAGLAYEQGDYDGAISMLKWALAECNLDKGEKIEANKQLILSYFKVDNLEAADKTAEAIMKIDPYYKPDKFKDDPRLSSLFDKYQPTPIFRIGLSAGINRSIISVDKYYSIVHNDDEASNFSEYNSKTGFQLGLNAEYKAYKNLWVELGFLFRQTQYEHILDSVENTSVTYSEKLSYFDMPLTLRYYIFDKTYSPYVFGGADFSFLTNALSTTSRDDLKDIVNRTDYRNAFYMGYFGGAGISMKLKGLQLFADLRYVYYPENVNKEGTRYDDLTNVFKYYYIDDDFRMDNWQFNVGVSYNLAYRNRKVE
jgi:hypothetical protein